MSRGGVYTAIAFICTLYEKNATWALFLVLEKNLHCLKIYMKNLLNDPSYIRPCGFHKALPYAIDCDLLIVGGEGGAILIVSVAQLRRWGL